VPASLDKCTELQRLALSGNQLEGPIPDELGDGGELEALELQKKRRSSFRQLPGVSKDSD
tara:strand:- start:283 stop:462 length:180 start_codon:yes stop_codon:yes gene_type:complete